MSPRRAAAWVAFFAALVMLAVQTIDDGSTPGGEPRDAGDRSGRNGARADESDRRAGSGRDGFDDGAEAVKPRVVRVQRVVDGDTIVVRTGGGATERVRYIGVDTPESVKPNSPVECFGKQAAQFNRSLVEGREARLEFDREPRDRYGRTLAYVYVGDVLVNAELLENGYARTIEIEPNTSMAPRFARLERVAIRTNIGLWRACDR